MNLNKNQKLALIGGGVLLLAIFGKRIFQSKSAKTDQAGIGGKPSYYGDSVFYKVPTWALNFLVNNDPSGLSDDEIEKVNKFANEVYEDTGRDISVGDGISNEPYFSWKNDVDGNLGADVVDVEVAVAPNWGTDEDNSFNYMPSE